MKNIFYLFNLFFIFSCKPSAEETCFISKETPFEYVEPKSLSVQEILKEKPKYLDVLDLKKFRSFKQDSIEQHSAEWDEEASLKKINLYKKKYAEFDKYFGDQFSFGYIEKKQINNITYALAKGSGGNWLLKIENGKSSAYFLGLTYSHYYINSKQDLPIIKDGFLQFEGSFVKIIKVPGLPGYDDYSSIKDGNLFRIKLTDLEKDSDRDGYNDILEKAIGLNPNKKDTDDDEIDDFNDLNPKYKSENNKYTELYLQISNGHQFANLIAKNNPYFFTFYESDCEYFHKINPENSRVIFIPKKDKDKTYYERITDLTDFGISKMKKTNGNPDKVYISTWGSSYSNDYAAEYIKGKWVLTLVSGKVI